jgi:hypothetical protein
MKETLKLKYEFDCGCDYEYRDFDGEEFIYEVDIEDIKYDIIKSEIKKLELDINTFDVIEILDSLLLWDNLIDEDEAWYDYKREAMAWFKDEHPIESKEDYERE